jgi:hypothetical protein
MTTLPLKLILAAIVLSVAAPACHGAIIVNVQSSDVTFNPAMGLLYVSSPSSASTNPNTLVPINPTTGALGTPIAVLTNPSRVVSSGDGTFLYVVANNGQSVQRYNPSTGQFATKLSILNNNVNQIVAVPGYSDLVAIEQNAPGFSPPAIQSALYQNGTALPNHIGNGLGVGGPDIIAVNDTGTLFYGYQTTVTSYTNWTAAITPGPSGGLTSTSAPTLQNVLTGPRGRIDVASNMLFDDNGHIYDTVNPSLLALFPTTGAFALDPQHHRFYSMVNSGSSQTVDVFDMDVTNSLKLLGTIPASGEVGGVGEITRFGSNGLALRTPTQVILLTSALVPEPPTSVLALLAGLVIGGAIVVRRRLRPRRRERVGRRMIAAIAGTLMLCSGARAGLIASDDFSYLPIGGALNGHQGGGSTGFSGPWSGDASYAVLGGNLPSPVIPAPTGNMVSSSAFGGNRQIVRPLAAALGTPGTSTYMSFTLRPDGVLHGGAFGGWFGVFFNGGAGSHEAGFSMGSNDDFYGIDVVGGPFSLTSTKAVVGTPVFAVMRFDWTTGPDPMTLYINPPPGTVEPATPDAQLLGQDLGTETTFVLTGPGATSFDNLRIGTTYASVAIPEPSSVILVGLGVGSLSFVIGHRLIRRRGLCSRRLTY